VLAMHASYYCATASVSTDCATVSVTVRHCSILPCNSVSRYKNTLSEMRAPVSAPDNTILTNNTCLIT